MLHAALRLLRCPVDVLRLQANLLPHPFEAAPAAVDLLVRHRSNFIDRIPNQGCSALVLVKSVIIALVVLPQSRLHLIAFSFFKAERRQGESTMRDFMLPENSLKWAIFSGLIARPLRPRRISEILSFSPG
jgi:hypothetical protein